MVNLCLCVECSCYFLLLFFMNGLICKKENASHNIIAMIFTAL
jgi:hypothetical protein